MKYSAKQYATALHQALLESHPKDQERILDEMAKILKENGDLGGMDQIEEAFHNCVREAQGVKLAEITSARKLSRAEEQGIIKKLNDHVGGKVELKKKIDEGLIGGVVVRIDDELLDGSLKSSLQELKDKLVAL